MCLLLKNYVNCIMRHQATFHHLILLNSFIRRLRRRVGFVPAGFVLRIEPDRDVDRQNDEAYPGGRPTDFQAVEVHHADEA